MQSESTRVANLEGKVRRLTALIAFLSIGFVILLLLEFLPQPPVLDAIGQRLGVPDRHRWRGQVIDSPAGPLYWHPVLGYVSVPDPDDDP